MKNRYFSLTSKKIVTTKICKFDTQPEKFIKLKLQ